MLSVCFGRQVFKSNHQALSKRPTLIHHSARVVVTNIARTQQATGGLSSKSFNNMMLKLGKSGGTSGGSGGNLGHSQSRPAQGGVVIKMDFVRIEH